MKFLPLPARRVFRLAGVMAVALAIAYGAAVPLPFLAPIFGFVLTAQPSPPRGLKAMIGLSLVISVTFGLGVLLAPVLIAYPVTGILLAATGIYISNYLSINLARGPIGTLLIMGVAMISSAGTLSTAAAVMVINALLICIGIAVLSQWIVYPLFPEDDAGGAGAGAGTQAPAAAGTDGWIALRATLVVVPAFLLTLTNPTLYLPVIMKSVILGQQASGMALKGAGRELLGSTFLAGLLALGFWFFLGLSVNLWMFFLLMLLIGIACASRFYGVVKSPHPPSYWQNVVITLLILLGSAVQDSATGNDVYQAFATRMSLFVAVTLYAWFAIVVLESLRSYVNARRQQKMGVA